MRAANGSDIILLALSVTFLPPTLLVLLEALCSRSACPAVLHLVFVGLLLARSLVQAISGWER